MLSRLAVTSLSKPPTIKSPLKSRLLSSRLVKVSSSKSPYFRLQATVNIIDTPLDRPATQEGRNATTQNPLLSNQNQHVSLFRSIHLDPFTSLSPAQTRAYIACQ